MARCHSPRCRRMPLCSSPRRIASSRRRSSLGAWAHCSRGRRTLLAVVGCVCVSVAGALHGHVGLSRLGWEVTEDFMKESEKLYDQMDDAGVTKLEVTAATTAAPEPPAEDDGSANNQGGQQGIQQGDLQGDQQVNQQGGQQGEEGQQGQKEQYSQQWQQGAQWQQERQWQRTPEQVPQDGTWVNMAAPVQVGQTSQPRERLTTPNAKTTKTIHFNPCQDAESQKMQWTKGALADQCEVDAAADASFAHGCCSMTASTASTTSCHSRVSTTSSLRSRY